MPELYGNPRKSELRIEISKLKSDVASLMDENRKLRRSIEWARASNTELQIKIQRMEALAKEAMSIAAIDIDARVIDRIQADRRARMDAIFAEHAE